MKGAASVFVLYHFPCPDGGFSALAAWLAHGRNVAGNLTFVPHSTVNALDLSTLAGLTDSNVYLVDYVGPKGFLTEISSLCKHVTLLDHHKTAKEELERLESENALPANLSHTVVMDKSGAVVTLEHFEVQVSESLKRVFDYIQDNDLWHHKLPNSKAFSAGLRDLKLSWNFVQEPALFEQLEALDVDEVIARGKIVLEKEQQLISHEVNNESFVIHLGGKQCDFGTCLAVDTKHPMLRSGMGNALAEKSKQDGHRAVGAIAYEDKGAWKVSLRSIGNEDTTVISKHFGGGGHLNASSFLLQRSQWNQWKKILN